MLPEVAPACGGADVDEAVPEMMAHAHHHPAQRRHRRIVFIDREWICFFLLLLTLTYAVVLLDVAINLSREFGRTLTVVFSLWNSSACPMLHSVYLYI